MFFFLGSSKSKSEVLTSMVLEDFDDDDASEFYIS